MWRSRKPQCDIYYLLPLLKLLRVNEHHSTGQSVNEHHSTGQSVNEHHSTGQRVMIRKRFKTSDIDDYNVALLGQMTVKRDRKCTTRIRKRLRRKW